MTCKNKHFTGLFFLALLLLMACTTSPSEPHNASPTINPLYQSMPTATPGATTLPTTPTPVPTLLPTPTETNLLPMEPVNEQPEGINVIEAIPLLSDTRAETIFGERLAPNWSVEHSWSTDIDLTNEEYSIMGDKGIKLIPYDEFGAIFFTVRDTARKPYLRDEVLGIRFWLFTYNDYIATDDLVIALLGSNEYPYWVENDDSVAGINNQEEAEFSETQLFFLNVSRDIPPNTWINIELWIDDLIYDPDYEYLTGFYIKNDADFQRPYYIDDVEILLLKENSEE